MAQVTPGSAAGVYLIICPLDGGNVHVVGGGAHIFILLVGEDVDTNQVHLQGAKPAVSEERWFHRPHVLQCIQVRLLRLK